MGYLTIQEAAKYTGLSRQTILAWLARGALQGRKTGGSTAPWVIPSEEVERVRREQLATLEARISAISKPVPNGVG